jgi:hypothetical protein
MSRPPSSGNDRMTAVTDRGSRSRTAGNYLQKAAAIYGRTEVPAADHDLSAATRNYCIDRRSPRQNLCDSAAEEVEASAGLAGGNNDRLAAAHDRKG